MKLLVEANIAYIVSFMYHLIFKLCLAWKAPKNAENFISRNMSNFRVIQIRVCYLKYKL